MGLLISCDVDKYSHKILYLAQYLFWNIDKKTVTISAYELSPVNKLLSHHIDLLLRNTFLNHSIYRLTVDDLGLAIIALYVNHSRSLCTTSPNTIHPSRAWPWKGLYSTMQNQCHTNNTTLSIKGSAAGQMYGHHFTLIIYGPVIICLFMTLRTPGGPALP